MPSESKTTWTLYSDNDKAWNAMLADCVKAKKSIVLEQFIFVADDFGRKLIDICAEQARSGVTVRFLWDAAGSFSLTGSAMIEELRSKGIEMRFWKTLIPGYFSVPNIRSWYLRNHRRTLVIDDAVGYTGSICVSDSMKNWRDTNVRVVGPIVGEMSNAFERMWQRTENRKRLVPRFHTRDPQFKYLTNGPTPGGRHIYKNILKAIRAAEKHIYITTPYFVPTHRIIRALKHAARRGVDVRLLLPERSDHYPTLDLGARSYFATLMESGVHIFLYTGTVIHSKTITIDDTWSTVGSLNLDNASLLYNYEANIVSTDAAFSQELRKHFSADLTRSRQIDLSAWKNRFFLERVPEIVIRLVRRFL